MSAWKAYLAVGIGSGVGSALRYGVSLLSQAALGGYFPWGTLIVNSSHSALAHLQPLLVAGFCGGFTTFSLFSLETLHLVQVGKPVMALVYIVVSLPLWLGAAVVGERMALSR